MATRSKLEQVEREDGAGLDTRDVAERKSGLLAIGLGVVDDERPTTLAVTTTTELTLTGTEFLGCADAGKVWACTDGLQKGDSCRGFGNFAAFESGGRNDERDFRNASNLVTTGKEKRRCG